MFSSSATSRSPPARWTVTGLVHQPWCTAAPATATALVPERASPPLRAPRRRRTSAARRREPAERSCAPGSAVILDQRAQAEELVALRLAADDCMRVADRDRHEFDALVADVDRLRLPHLDRANVHLDLLAVAHRGDDLARPDGDPHLAGAATTGEPARRDPRSVAGELGGRAVRVPDHDLGAIAVRSRHLDDAVGADAEVVVAQPSGHARASAGRQAQPARPAGNRCRARATWRSSSAISPEGRSAFRLTRPGMRRIHLRW